MEVHRGFVKQREGESQRLVRTKEGQDVELEEGAQDHEEHQIPHFRAQA